MSRLTMLAIELEAATRAPGQYRITCPVCKGGRTGEQSMSLVVEEGGFSAICYRASCGVYACDSDRTYGAETPPKPAPPPLYPGYHEDTAFPPEGSYWYDILEADTLRIHKDGTGPLWTVETHCARNGLSVEAGDTDTLVIRANRAVVTRGKYKNIRTYRTGPGPIWYGAVNRRADRVVITEDVRGAIRAGGIALLGTHLPRELANELPVGPKYWVALDPGAELAAAKVVSTLKEAGRDAGFIPLKQDIKDMTTSEFRRLFVQ